MRDQDVWFAEDRRRAWDARYKLEMTLIALCDKPEDLRIMVAEGIIPAKPVDDYHHSIHNTIFAKKIKEEVTRS